MDFCRLYQFAVSIETTRAEPDANSRALHFGVRTRTILPQRQYRQIDKSTGRHVCSDFFEFFCCFVESSRASGKQKRGIKKLSLSLVRQNYTQVYVTNRIYHYRWYLGPYTHIDTRKSELRRVRYAPSLSHSCTLLSIPSNGKKNIAVYTFNARTQQKQKFRAPTLCHLSVCRRRRRKKGRVCVVISKPPTWNFFWAGYT